MRAQLVSEQQVINPAYNRQDATLAQLRGERYPHPLYLTKPAGTIIDNKKAYMLVRMGVAIPADDECRERAGLTDEQMKVAIHAQKRVAAGIHPDDYEKYDRGEITGYNADGTFKPGPNAPKQSEEESVAEWLMGDDGDE